MDMGTGRRIVVASAAGAMLLVGSVTLLGANATHSPAEAAAAAPTPASACSAAISRTIVPGEIRSCESATVTLAARPYCPGDPLDIVLVPCAYVNFKYGEPWITRATAAFIDSLAMSVHPNVRVGIVEFRDKGRVVLDLTNDEDLVRRKSRINFVEDYAATNLCSECVFNNAVKVLNDGGRRGRTVIVFIGWWWLFPGSPYPNYTQKSLEWLRGTQRAKSGANLFAIRCPDPGVLRCEYDTIDPSWHWYRNASPGYYFPGGSDQAFVGAMRALVQKTLRSELAAVSIEDQWPPGVDLVPGSITPAPGLDDAPNRRLRWVISAPITEALTLTYRVQPLAIGVHTFLGGQTVITDSLQKANVLPLPTGVLTVTGPCETPTFTPSPEPTPTFTATPGPTATWTPIATVTPTPTATATRRPAPLYLPLTLREECVPGQKRIDVALVIDASTSMLEPTAAGPTKLDTARAAVRSFLEQLNVDAGDQAAIIVFNAEATVLQNLTANRAALDRALDRIQTAQQTRIHRGIEEAARELTSSRHRPGNVPAMIVLTDGRANPDSPEMAIEAGQAATAQGITVFTIGLGNEVDFDALERMASKPGYFYRAPKAEDLEDIYREIARVIPCPPEQFWGRRP
jgi:Mg-chelatase subunit ChlD